MTFCGLPPGLVESQFLDESQMHWYSTYIETGLVTHGVARRSMRNGRAQKVSFPSSCRRIISLLQSPPCLQRILARVRDNVVRLTSPESHECGVHLLQHKLQVLHSSVLVRIRRQQLEINRCFRDFRRLLSGPLQHHLRLLDHTSKEGLRLL